MSMFDLPDKVARSVINEAIHRRITPTAMLAEMVRDYFENQSNAFGPIEQFCAGCGQQLQDEDYQ